VSFPYATKSVVNPVKLPLKEMFPILSKYCGSRMDPFPGKLSFLISEAVVAS
jgi:hypothetical protein